MPDSRIVVAAAGAGKSTWICDEAQGAAPNRVLLLTYTNANLRRLRQLLAGPSGVVPNHITLMTWFDFLLNQGARPYQRALTGQPNAVRGLQFDPPKPRSFKIPRSKLAYYATRRRDLYVDRVSDFVHAVNEKSEGKVVSRLAVLFDHIMVDEVQDMRGHDLEVFDALLSSPITVTLVGDPRQALLRTTLSRKNSRFGGSNLGEWAQARKKVCERLDLASSYRCAQEILDFADQLFPDFPRTKSLQSGSADWTESR